MIEIGRCVFGIERMEVVRVRRGVMPLLYSKKSRLMSPTDLLRRLQNGEK